MTVRALVIGAGPTTNLLHLPVLAKLRRAGRVGLAHICDIRRERAEEARQKFRFAEASGDAVAAIARPDIDAVYVFGSAQMHCEYGMRALESGKHVFVEKPIAPSFAEASEMAALARAKGLVAAGGHNRRFYRSLEVARERAGQAGWRSGEAVFHKPEAGKKAPFGARSWLGANGIHALDALVFAMGGLPEDMTALASEGPSGEPCAFSVVMRWRDGAQGAFLCNNEAGARREEYAFHAPGESLSIAETQFTIGTNGVLAKSSYTPADSFELEHAAFLDAIDGGTAPRHAIEALAPSLFLAELIENGHCGRVVLPATRAPTRSVERGPAAESILLVRPEGLESAVQQILSRRGLVSLDDVRNSPGSRPDVTAAILGNASAPLPNDILDKLPSLRLVGVAALSVARLNPDALEARGIRIVNASAAYAESVAEFALGLAILARRRAFPSAAVMRDGGWGTGGEARGLKAALLRNVRALRPILRGSAVEPILLSTWRKAKPILGVASTTGARDLKGATIGLIGWGANARAFAERVLAAGAHVLVYSEHAPDGEIRSQGATPASLGEVLAADIVSLHRGLTKKTRHCLGAAELARLRPGAVLINIARGALIEPQALYERLQKGDVFACLDTFEEEPPARSDPLRRLPNVFLTSHIAGGSRDMHEAAAEEIVRKVDAYLDGDTAADLIPRADRHRDVRRYSAGDSDST
jgi:phosphoglycerate dehydrogenase-like enzyme/predicted dehydrogenase